MVHTKDTLVDVLRAELLLQKSDANAAISLIISYIDKLPVGDKLVLRGFGTFERKHVTRTHNINPKTKEPMGTLSYTTIQFKRSKQLRSPSSRG